MDEKELGILRSISNKIKDAPKNYAPKANCKKCYGTGRLGFIDGNLRWPMLCKCVGQLYKRKS